MANITKALGRNRDLPQLEGIYIAGGTAAYEHVLAVVPNLATGATSGSVSSLPSNTMFARWLAIVWEATMTGVATNNVTINCNQYRAGALLVNTTIGAIAATGLQVATPTSMVNITLGTYLNIAAGGGSAEQVVVTAVTSTTFSAVFASTHNASTACTSSPLATITYASGTNDTKFVPRHLKSLPNQLLGGDILTVQLVVNGTGMTYQAATMWVDWEYYGILP